ncbi:hypothetical protein D3C85_760780 [compost metagenome]
MSLFIHQQDRGIVIDGFPVFRPVYLIVVAMFKDQSGDQRHGDAQYLKRNSAQVEDGYVSGFTWHVTY